MTVIFGLSAMMLVPKFRTVFKAPVPSIHNTIGISLIPWGLSYLVYLPDFYASLNNIAWREYAYTVVSLFTTIMCLSATAWAFVSVFQQGVRQRVIQPLILFIPVVIMAWYSFSPQEWLLEAFLVVCIVEVIAFSLYMVRLYHALLVDIKANYSNMNGKMLHSIRTLWVATAFAFTFFFITTVQDNVLWHIANVFTNLFTLCILIYTSEHLLPLPDKQSEEVSAPEEMHSQDTNDIRAALLAHCEQTLLFCNPHLSLQELAVSIGTNRTYLSKWFVRNNTTFYNYINGLRIDYAGHLLLTTDEPIIQVQTKSGFTNKSTFLKYFMERFQCTPTEYRASSVAPRLSS